jgi:hypothetical protein
MYEQDFRRIKVCETILIKLSIKIYIHSLSSHKNVFDRVLLFQKVLTNSENTINT